MHFDDRLATVLRNRATGVRAARTQFRQLLDLLGERAVAGDRRLARAAYHRLDVLARQIPLEERTAIVADAGWSREKAQEFLAHALECFTARFIAWRFDVHSIEDGSPCFAVDAKEVPGFINASIDSAGFAESFHRKFLDSV